MPETIKQWKIKESEYIGKYPVFNLRKDIRVSPRNAYEMSVYVLESRNWVNVIPITPDENVIMVRQFRFGTESITLEVPGGLIDDDDASLEEAARRELREETGYISEELDYLGKVYPNPAILNNACHTFVAHNVQLAVEQDLDDGEDIEIVQIPLADIPELVRNGTITHSIILNAFYKYDLKYRLK